MRACGLRYGPRGPARLRGGTLDSYNRLHRVGGEQNWGLTMDREERRQFVRDHRTCIFGYNRKNDGPAMNVVYYLMDGDDLLVSTMADRAKAKAVQRDA